MAQNNNRSLLRLMGLPVFEDVKTLADEMHVDERQLKLFVTYSRQGYYYRTYRIDKASGGSRRISQPGRRLKAVQAWILRTILDKLEPSPHAVAFRPRRGTREAVLPHAENRYFLCLDLAKFFDSIKKYQAEDVFRLIGYGDASAEILASLCTCRGCLPQGGVSSPAISNLVVSRLDRRIAGYASKRNIVYTRYADDLILSSNVPAILPRALRFIRHVVKSENLVVNEDKTRFLGPRQRCQILGLVKNNSAAGFGLGRHKKRQLRAAIFNVVVNEQFSKEIPTIHSINGWISYAKSVDPECGEQLHAYTLSLLDKTGNTGLLPS